MELLVDESTWCCSQVMLVIVVLQGEFLLFVMVVGALDIFIFDFDDVFLVFVDDAKEFSLDFDEMVGDLVFGEEEHFLLDDEFCMLKVVPERVSMSSMFFFFMVEFQ